MTESETSLRVKATSASVIGQNRGRNDDACWVDEANGFFGIADAMSGHRSGEVASALALATAHEHYVSAEKDPDDIIGVRTILADCIHAAARAIFHRGQQRPEAAGMSCSLTIAAVLPGTVVVAHVGSSRAYLLNNGRLRQLTDEHTLAGDLRRSGSVTVDEYQDHPFRSVVTRTVGLQPAARCDVIAVDVGPGDKIVLVSNGAAPNGRENKFIQACASGSAAVVELARSFGQKDDTSAVVVDVSDAGATAPASHREPILSALDLTPFRILSARQQLELIGAAEARAYEAGDIIVQVGDTLYGMEVIFMGEALLTGPGSVRQEIGPGATLGLLALAGPRPSYGRVVARTTVHSLRLSRSALEGVIQRRPWLGVRLLGLVAEEGATAHQRALERADLSAFWGKRRSVPPWEIV